MIFEKFRQATAIRGPDNLTREFSGTGLGLSIVKELCKMLRGEITFSSQLGTGSAFSVRLPVHLETVRDTSSAEESIQAAEWTNPPGRCRHRERRASAHGRFVIADWNSNGSRASLHRRSV